MTVRRSAETAPAINPLSWETIDLVRRHESIPQRRSSLFLLIDVQERLLPSVSERNGLIERCAFLLDAMRIMKVPVVYSEQYPKGLGPTDPALRQRLEGAERIEKTSFSVAGAEAFIKRLEEHRPTHVIVAGIEAHVCVAQSALDLFALGFEVSVVRDAISSRKPYDKDVAVERLKSAGLTVTSAEAIVFELLEVSGTPEFREVLKLVK